MQILLKRGIVYLVISSYLLQVGCSSITQIPYPVDERKSENEIRQLNYFGERLTSTIELTNSCEIEAYWMQMRDNKIYFLTEGFDDTTSLVIEKIKTVRFYDAYGGCMKGGLLSLSLFALTGVAFGSSTNQNSSSESKAFTGLLVFAISARIGVASVCFSLGGENLILFKVNQLLNKWNFSFVKI